MLNEELEYVIKKLRLKGYRITNVRKQIMNLLYDKHLTFKELEFKLKEIGFSNLATLYNNIDFLIENNIVTEVFLNEKKYYDLIVEKNTHNQNNYVHVVCTNKNQIIEILDEDLLHTIKKHSSLSEFSVDSVKVSIVATCKAVKCKKNCR